MDVHLSEERHKKGKESIRMHLTQEGDLYKGRQSIQCVKRLLLSLQGEEGVIFCLSTHVSLLVMTTESGPDLEQQLLVQFQSVSFVCIWMDM